MILRVAAAQIPVGDKLEANLNVILESMIECAQQGVDLVVFPETALTGYSPAIGSNRSPEEWPAIEEALDAIGNQARESEMATVVGSSAWDGMNWTNRAYAYDEMGQLAATYDKTYLMRADTPFYRQGSGPVLWEWRGVKVGLLICYDVRFPEIYRKLLHQGVQIIVQGFYAAGGATWKVPVMGAHLVGRAAETGCFVVAANVANPLQMVRSQIIDPLGITLAEAEPDQQELLVADLDLDRIRNSEIRDDYLTRFGGS